jgi:glycosyltransferase involved in cell wall biosynthesis
MSGGTRSFEFAKRLVAKGHEVNMITSSRNFNEKKKWFKTVEDGINVYWLPLPYSNKMNYRKRIIVFFKFALYSAIKSASLRSDIIFASSTPLTIALPAVYASKKNKVPLVLEIRDIWPQIPIALNVLKNPILRFLAGFLEKWSYKHSKAIVTLSPTMKQEIISKNISSKKIAVIPNSSDIDNFKNINFNLDNFFKSRPYIKNKPFLLYAGTFGKVNNLNYSIKLAQALLEINSNVNILLIGDGVEKSSLIEEAKKKMFIMLICLWRIESQKMKYLIHFQQQLCVQILY